MPLQDRVFLCRLTASLLAVLLLLACVGCAQPEPAMSFADLLARVESRKKEFCAAYPTDISDFTPDLRGREYLISDEEMEILTTPVDAKKVTVAEAREDVHTAFRLLKHSYSAYDYFGGDEVFYAARKEILDALPAEGNVAPAKLEQAFIDALAPILQDCHFRIEGEVLPSSNGKQCWYVPDLYFNDPADAGASVAEYVRLTVDEVGRLRYGLVAYVTMAEEAALPTRAEIGGRTVFLRWKRDLPADTKTDDIFTEKVIGGDIPYLALTALQSSAKDQEKKAEQAAQLERFVESGKTYADASLLVLDLRGNGGGYTVYGIDWFENYTHWEPMIPETWLMKYSKLNVYAAKRDGWLSYDAPTGMWEHYTKDRYKGRHTPREGITFVLADQETASAAEYMLFYALTLENAVIVGGNSLGCHFVGGNCYYYLPHSGLQIRLGSTLSLVGDLGNFDGIGIAPDIWTPSKDADDAVLRMIEYYGLNA